MPDGQLPITIRVDLLGKENIDKVTTALGTLSAQTTAATRQGLLPLTEGFRKSLIDMARVKSVSKDVAHRFYDLTRSTTAMAGNFGLMLPKSVWEFVNALEKAETTGKVNVVQLDALGRSALVDAANFDIFVKTGKIGNLTLEEMTHAAQAGTLSLGAMGSEVQKRVIDLSRLNAATSQTQAEIKALTRSSSTGQRQTKEMGEALAFTQSAAHGAMLGFGALRGSLLQVMFSIIFLRFSLVGVTLTIAGTIIAIGSLAKAFMSYTKALITAGTESEAFARTIEWTTKSISEMAAALSYTRQTAINYGVKLKDIEEATLKFNKAGILSNEIVLATVRYQRRAGIEFSAAADQIIAAVKGEISSLEGLTDAEHRRLGIMWESMSTQARISRLIQFTGKEMKGLEDVTKATTSEMALTIRQGFGSIIKVMGIEFTEMTVEPLLIVLAKIATWFSMLSEIVSKFKAVVRAMAITGFVVLATITGVVIKALIVLWAKFVLVSAEVKVLWAQLVGFAATLKTVVIPAILGTSVATGALAGSMSAASAATLLYVASTSGAVVATKMIGAASITAATKVGFLSRIFRMVAPILRWVGIIGAIIVSIPYLISGIKGLTKNLKDLASWLKIIGAVAVIVVAILFAIGTLGAGTAISIGLIGGAAMMLSDAFGHSPGLVQDLDRFKFGLEKLTIPLGSIASRMRVFKDAVTQASKAMARTREPAANLRVSLAGILPAQISLPSWLTGGWWSKLWSGIQSWFMTTIYPFFAVTVSGWWEGIKTGWGKAMDTIKGKLEEWWASLKTFFAPVTTFFTQTVPEWWDSIRGGISAALEVIETKLAEWWANIRTFLAPAMTFFTKTIPGWWNIIKNAWMLALETIQTKFAEWWAALTIFFAPVIEFFTITVAGWWNTIRDLWQSALEVIRTNFATWWENIKIFFSPVSIFFTETVPGWFTSMKDKIADIINDVIDNINSLIEWINKIPVPSIEIPKIPRIPTAGAGIIGGQYGFQGIVKQPTLFLAGERGAEAVSISPLGRAGGYGQINVYITGNYILDDPTAKRLADIVSDKITRTLGRYRSVTSVV